MTYSHVSRLVTRGTPHHHACWLYLLLCRAGFWDLYATPAPKAKNPETSDWVQWVDMRDVIRKCAAKGVGQPVPEGEQQCSATDRQTVPAHSNT